MPQNAHCRTVLTSSASIALSQDAHIAAVAKRHEVRTLSSILLKREQTRRRSGFELRKYQAGLWLSTDMMTRLAQLC